MSNISDEPWYGVRVTFDTGKTNHKNERLYEERVLIIKASSFDEAITMADEIALDYAVDGYW